MCTIVKRVVDLVVRARGDVWEVLLLHSCAIEHLTAGAMNANRYQTAAFINHTVAARCSESFQYMKNKPYFNKYGRRRG